MLHVKLFLCARPDPGRMRMMEVRRPMGWSRPIAWVSKVQGAASPNALLKM